MKRLITTACLMLSTILLAACTGITGSGTVTTETVEVSSFNRIDLTGIGNLIIRSGETESLQITTDDNIHQYIETNVSGDTLSIGIQQGVTILDTTELRYEISVADLEAVDVAGAGNMTIDDLSTDELTVSISGAGDIILNNIDTQMLETTISGSGNLIANGTAADFTATINGAGDINAAELETQTANLTINGAGSADITVNEQLTGSINGAGDIVYRGDVTTVDVSQAGVGSVNRATDNS